MVGIRFYLVGVVYISYIFQTVCRFRRQKQNPLIPSCDIAWHRMKISHVFIIMFHLFNNIFFFKTKSQWESAYATINLLPDSASLLHAQSTSLLVLFYKWIIVFQISLFYFIFHINYIPLISYSVQYSTLSKNPIKTHLITPSPLGNKHHLSPLFHYHISPSISFLQNPKPVHQRTQQWRSSNAASSQRTPNPTSP